MDSNNRLDTKHLKQIVNEIVTEEQEKNSLNVNVFPVTFIEYYTEYLFKKKFSLKKVFNSALYPVSSKGFFSEWAGTSRSSYTTRICKNDKCPRVNCFKNCGKQIFKM